MPTATKPITDVKVRMYKMGTGDCISVKFFHKDEATFSMLFDCGCWTGSKTRLTPFVKELIRDLDGKVDVLVVTHEHQDHVLGFQRCEELLVSGFAAGEIWMGWTEDDSKSKIKTWKEKYGEKKMALALAAERLSEEVDSAEFANQLAGSAESPEILAFHKSFAASVKDFAALHANEDAEVYKGPLEGMRVVKEELECDHEISYLSPGEILYDIDGLDGVRIFVLGPPTGHKQIKKEHSENPNESYQHNNELDAEDFALNHMRSKLDDSDFFARTVNAGKHVTSDPTLTPFPSSTYATRAAAKKSPYEKEDESWRRIDNEWLQSSANLALRMNSLTNNLSVVLAIQFEDSGKVMLFPGDAEFGSWESWHDIDWSSKHWFRNDGPSRSDRNGHA
jgi:beta-lactamase superfamily II metal-dependent hydrolase